MQGIKIAAFVALAHLSKICATLLIIKMIAIKLGPEGMGFLGNYMSLISIATVMAGGGITSGIIKYVSEYFDDDFRRASFIRNSLIYSVLFSLFLLLIFFPFDDEIAQNIFGEESYSIYIKVFLISQIFSGVTNFFYGVFNGLKENWMYSISVFSANIVVSLLAFFVIKKYHMQGAIAALTLPLVISFIPALYLFFYKKIKINLLRFDYFFEDSYKLFKYTLMLAFSAACFPVVEIYIRKIILEFLNLNSVGLWQAMMKFSTSYLSFFAIFLSFYLIPKISAEKKFCHMKINVFKSMAFVSVFFLIIFLAFLINSDSIIELIFSNSFIEISNYIFIQMAGDFFRVIGWVIGFVVVAKAATKIYILGEIFQAIIFLIFVIILLKLEFGISGVAYAYLFGNMIYCFAACVGFFVIYRKNIES